VHIFAFGLVSCLLEPVERCRRNTKAKKTALAPRHLDAEQEKAKLQERLLIELQRKMHLL
jgi:hypothetical protein